MTLCRSVDVCRGLCRVCVECVSMLLDRSYVHVVSMCVGVSECRSVGVSECQSVGVCVGASVKGSALVMGPTPIHPSIHKVCHLKGRASSQGHCFSSTFVMCSIRHSNTHEPIHGGPCRVPVGSLSGTVGLSGPCRAVVGCRHDSMTGVYALSQLHTT